MTRILITGMSGVGKTSLLEELARRGRLTIDTDYGEWELSGSVWDEPKMSKLLAGHHDLVVSGTVENQGHFYDRFDHVILLSAPIDVLLERVARRDNNPYGKSLKQQEEIRTYTRDVEPLLRQGASLELDGRRPLAELAETVEALM